MPYRETDCTGNPKCWLRSARERCDNCKRKHAARQLQHYHRNREHINAQRRERRHRLYGLTKPEHLALFEQTDGLCALCLDEPATVVDHDHETGAVRGALCGRCNKGLGFFEAMGGADPILEYLGTAHLAALGTGTRAYLSHRGKKSAA